MPRTKLTQLAVGKLQEPGVHWDVHLPGFGLRISPKGRKSWVVFYRVRHKQVMETLGTTKLIPKVDDARQRARESQLKARAGVNPVAEKRAALSLEAQKQTATIKSVVDRYFVEWVKVRQKASSARESRRIFDKDILPHWATRDIASISSKDVRRLLEKVGDRGSLIVANIVLLKLRTFFRWAVRAEFLEKDPTGSIDKLVEIVERDRILTDPEIVLFWNACESIGWPYGPLCKILLLTAQRRNEVSGMTWSEIDFNKSLWVIPRERAKSDRVHEVHLSDMAVSILQSLPAINESNLVFTSTGIRLTSWNSAKLALDKHMKCPPWRLHDLRRTATSGMARLNISPHVVDKILNHSGGTIKGVAAIYNRYNYSDERRSALEAWSRYVFTLLNPPTDKIVPLRHRI